ncbi:MAG: protocatechuate 3,4-dioxygenase [Xanthomonadales bacterium]|nr:protocatechuate 3,4-dioxygenase [Xanthomonadales bacterium]
MTGTRLNRRRALFGMVAAATGPWIALRADDGLLEPTPGDAEGPFYPVDIPQDSDNDLLRIVGRDAAALGQPTWVHGRVTDRTGQHIDGARIEIWQCDHGGVYHHPGDRGRPDDNFQGFGAMVTDREGDYHFRTLRPVPYTGRTPHIHFRVSAPGFGRLTTQLYVAEEAERNQRDFLYQRHGPAARLVTTAFQPIDATPGSALAARFDIVLA